MQPVYVYTIICHNEKNNSNTHTKKETKLLYDKSPDNYVLMHKALWQSHENWLIKKYFFSCIV